MNYRIIHKTSYEYSEQASISQNELYLKPRETATQQVLQSDLQILPKVQYFRNRTDYFGNNAQLFMVQRPHNQLVVTSTNLVRTSFPYTPTATETAPWELVVHRLITHELEAEFEAYQYVFTSPLTIMNPAIRAYALESFPPGTPILVGALNLMQRIFTEFAYDKSATMVDTPVEQVFLNKKGVCQDFAHLMISCLRSLGLAARYVSGYMETVPPPGKPKLVGADASHAWLSIYIQEGIWVDLDPTNNLIPGEKHITVAWGRDYSDVTPVKGVVMGGGTHSLSVMVDVAGIV